MKSALVYGADEFFGLSFCECLLEEGVDIGVKLDDPSDETKRLYLEERLMWLVRNQHFRMIEKEPETEYDKVFIQYTGCMLDEELDDLIQNKPVFLFVYQHQMVEDLRERFEQKGADIIVLPDMYGPWDVREDDSVQRESCFFVDDIAAQLAVYTAQNDPSGLQFKQQTTAEEAEAIIEEWKRQMSTFFDKK
ncbi:hypothetical protein VSK91_15460 [Bacillus swezeyi]|uniref:Uncharacterized protein n=2 Tax=Bacillus swezeyi TaxID=1925020 RepID=A0A5M8S148_9BACI|nr:hypothetical protein [Bacillus swezeyi]KAA6453323.1 hypothetical protein DX927_03750 [Bacillus swezeyi]KAA6476059.1 hypothetical protein DX928_08170 [Bacillus swezeyi]TYS38696.1 hypothetical protein FZC77_03635 [Bacillus swezeyi]